MKKIGSLIIAAFLFAACNNSGTGTNTSDTTSGNTYDTGSGNNMMDTSQHMDTSMSPNRMDTSMKK